VIGNLYFKERKKKGKEGGRIRDVLEINSGSGKVWAREKEHLYSWKTSET